MSDVYVIGVDMIRFGRFPDRTVPDLAAEAALLALDDAGLTIRDMQALYCGNLADSIDHIMPRSRGGQHEWENVAAACRPCNLHKRDRTPDEAQMRLARPPRAPKELAWVLISVNRVPDAWKPYLARAS